MSMSDLVAARKRLGALMVESGIERLPPACRGESWDLDSADDVALLTRLFESSREDQVFKTQQDHARAEALALVRRFAAELPTQVVSVGYFKRVMVGRWFRREREVWHEHESLSAAVVGVRGAAGSRPWFAVTDDAVLVCEVSRRTRIACGRSGFSVMGSRMRARSGWSGILGRRSVSVSECWTRSPRIWNRRCPPSCSSVIRRPGARSLRSRRRAVRPGGLSDCWRFGRSSVGRRGCSVPRGVGSCGSCSPARRCRGCGG